MRSRIPVTALDQYQYFLDSDMSEQEFIHSITTKSPPTVAMAVGIAWHSILENWQGETADNRYYQDGFVFDLSQLNSDDEIIIGEASQREKKQVWQGVDGVDLVGKFDVITPFAIIDHKLTANFDPERYFNSWQWRAYLMMTGKPKMIYQVFEHTGLNGDVITIKDYHRLEVLAYDGMTGDVKEIVCDFNALLKKHGVF